MEENILEKKYQYWQNQLLELGKRNKMISYRETKRTTLKILEPGFEELFTRVTINEEELTFQKPISKDSDIRVYSVLELLNVLSAHIDNYFFEMFRALFIENKADSLKKGYHKIEMIALFFNV